MMRNTVTVFNARAAALAGSDPNTQTYYCQHAPHQHLSKPPAIYASHRAPDDKAIVRELHALRQVQKEERKASARLFKGTLGAATPAVAAIRQQQQQELQQGRRRQGLLARLLSQLLACFDSIVQGIRALLMPTGVPANAHHT